MSGTFRVINPRYPEGYQRLQPKWEVYRLRYADDLKRKCPVCGQQFKRNDLAVVVTGPHGTKIYHRPCWFEEQGRPDWYYPGALADIGVGFEEADPAAKEDMPEAVEGAQVPLELAETGPVSELPGALPPPRPRSMAPEADDAPETQSEVEPEQPEMESELQEEEHESQPPPLSWRWWKKRWRKHGQPPQAEENPMRRYRRNPNRHPESTSERPEVAIYAGGSPDRGTYTGTPERATIGTPSYYRYEPEKKGHGLAVLLVLVGLGGAAFAGYWFLVRAKYGVGQMLQHIVDANTTVTYQITGLKYSGLTHEYVMTNQSTNASETFSVSSVDGDTADWIPTS